MLGQYLRRFEALEIIVHENPAFENGKFDWWDEFTLVKRWIGGRDRNLEPPSTTTGT